MLTDPVEIEIISRARQKNVRDHQRSRAHFENIFEDFFSGVNFNSKRLMDLGAGHYDFGVLARERGAAETLGVDNDPAVLELGRHKGFPVRDYQLRDLRAADFDVPYDGVFCKFSINAFWNWSDSEAHRAFIGEIDALIAADGWAWIAPWNGVPKQAALNESDVRRVVAEQVAAFRALGFNCYDLPRDLAARYGVTGAVVSHLLFTRSLSAPPGIATTCEVR